MQEKYSSKIDSMFQTAHVHVPSQVKWLHVRRQLKHLSRDKGERIAL